MFGWWMGRGGADRGQDGAEDTEPPETPAPVFAVRALKSAVWGTPAAPEDDTIHELEREKQDENNAWKQARLADIGGISPTKPAGILLTPGTGAARRKNVVFGTEVVDNEGKSAARKAVLRDGINTSSSLDSSSRPRAKTSLTRALENSRQRKAKTPSSEGVISQPQEFSPVLDLGKVSEEKGVSAGSRRKAPTSKKNTHEFTQQVVTGLDNDGDMTMDLNEPHSQSGKYWKSEFETYQGEMKEQMEKLLRYKLLAKSYAKKKDAEASELSAKLSEEQHRVNKMEERMTELSARIAIEEPGDESPELIKELARQTALAAQFRSQVEEFKAALEGNMELASHATGNKALSSLKDQELVETRQELRKAKSQVKEAASLQDEVKRLRQSLSIAEKATLNLQEENTKVTRDLLHTEFRLEKYLETSEKQRLSLEERMRKKDEVLRNLQKDYDTLKEQMKTQRRDSEHLLKKRHDQVAALRKELAKVSEAESRAQDIQIAFGSKVAERDGTISDYPKKAVELKGHRRDDDNSIDAVDVSSQPQSSQHRFSRSESLLKSRLSHDLILDSQIPILGHSVVRTSQSLAQLRSTRSDTPAGSPALKHQQSYPALSEININSGSTREHPAFQKFDLLRSTPLYNRTQDVMLEEPKMDLPSPEPSLVGVRGRPRHEGKFQQSPRPSMFNIASSPPKPAMVRSLSSDKLSTRRSIGDLARSRNADMSSSRLSKIGRSGSKGKSTLPPERAAAAKARLRQKNAEKKKAHARSTGKENVR